MSRTPIPQKPTSTPLDFMVGCGYIAPMPQSQLPIVVLRVARKINYAQIPDCCTFSNLIPVIAYEYRAKYYTFAFLRILVFLPKLFLNFKGLLWHELWYISKN